MTKYNISLEIATLGGSTFTTTDKGVLDALFMKHDLHFKVTQEGQSSEVFIPYHAVDNVRITRTTEEAAKPEDTNCKEIEIGCKSSDETPDTPTP